jgi:predicted DNA-binding protein YlxM (UPF0122 family)
LVNTKGLFLWVQIYYQTLSTRKPNMEKWFWEDFDAEELNDEIALAKGVIEDALKDKSLSDKTRQTVMDYYLDKLKSLYNEQRKRSIIE